MMNIFDSGFKKKQQPPEPPIYGSCLSDLSMVNNKEGGNETKMKRLKAFVRRHILLPDVESWEQWSRRRQRGDEDGGRSTVPTRLQGEQQETLITKL